MDISRMSFQDRLGETFKRTLPKLGPEARAQLAAMINPQSLAIIAGVLVAWIVSHAFGVGEIIDIILLVVGAAAVGLSVFTGLDHLYDFAVGAYRARTAPELDVAADHLAKAISILGIQAVLAVLFRGAKAPRTGSGARFRPGPPPPRTPGLRYRPNVRHDPTLPPGRGSTSLYGDIVVSSRGSAQQQAVTLLHEKVHQFLVPKLYFLRNYRVSNRVSSYLRSSLWRYIEEALAETIAQVGVHGFRQLFTGLRFPIRQGYLYLKQGGGYSPHFTGSGAIPEAAALLYKGIVAGIAIEIWGAPSEPASQSVRRDHAQAY
jgi:hypothetical protein